MFHCKSGKKFQLPIRSEDTVQLMLCVSGRVYNSNKVIRLCIDGLVQDWYLQCVSTADTTGLHQATDIMATSLSRYIHLLAYCTFTLLSWYEIVSFKKVEHINASQVYFVKSVSVSS